MQLLEVLSDASRLRRAVALSLAVLASAPLAAAAAGRHDRVPARTSAPSAGVVYAGVTPQGFPVMVELSKSGRQVVRAVVGLALTCTSGGSIGLPDGWSRLTVRKRAFSQTFGPESQALPDGSTLEVQGAVSGNVNSSRTRIAGQWSLKLTVRDVAGTVTDTCDSGTVSWTAKQ